MERTAYRYQFKTDKKDKSSPVYTVTAPVWLFSGNGAWYFVTVPAATSKKLKTRYGLSAKGWGSLPVEATVGRTSWRTSLFPYEKAGGYILPLKAAVRKAENIKVRSRIRLSVKICL